jgi:sugar lactone lactonase YvrE
MKTETTLLKTLVVITCALVGAGLHLAAQSAPTITTQPAGQTNLPGTTASFSVAVAGTGPFTYQWQLNGATNIITSVAGNGAALDAGDGTPAADASLDFPSGVVVDAAGNLYIADQFNHRIRRVDPNGIITTVAGNGAAAYAGDGGAATNASLRNPSGVALDAAGNLYIADQLNGRVRRVDPNGTITTVAGNGTGISSGDGGAATNAGLVAPAGVALDAAGNLYVADMGGDRVRLVNPNGIISTVAGDGSGVSLAYGEGYYAGDGFAATNASLVAPAGVALDAAGNLYVADSVNDRVCKVDSNGIITTVAGNTMPFYAGDGGAATNASLDYPVGVAFDPAGNLYIADQNNGRIRLVTADGLITTVAGNGLGPYLGDGGAANVGLKYPSGAGCDAVGNLYVADSGNARVRAVHLAGLPTLTLTGVSPGAAGNYSVLVTSPYGAVTSAVATLTVAAPAEITVQPAGGTVLAGNGLTFSVAAVGSGPFGYEWCFDTTNLVQSGTNNLLTLSNVTMNQAGNYSVVITNSYGSVTGAVAVLTVLPAEITVQPANQSAVVGGNPVFSVTAVGSGPLGYGWYFDATNLVQAGTNPSLTLSNVSTNQAGNYSVVITNSCGSVTSQVAVLTVNLPPSVTTQPTAQTNLAGTTASFNVAAGGTGPFTYQWQFNGANLTNGLITTLAGNGFAGYAGDGGAATNASLDYPVGMTFDAAGNLLIADSVHNLVRKVSPAGLLTTVAGDATGAFAGDQGAAIFASLHNLQDVTMDAFGNLYIADSGNNRIRRVDTNGLITTVAGNGVAAFAGDGGPATNASLDAPVGVAFDPAGNLYVADSLNGCIRKVDTNGLIATVAGNGLSSPLGDGGAATNASLIPARLVFDPAGNLYFADPGNQRVRKVDLKGVITTVAGAGVAGYFGDGGAATNAGLDNPADVAFDSVGNLYIADSANECIRRVDPNGLITTVAGKGVAGSFGDGGAATNAELNYPSGVACDAHGNLFVGDKYNNRIRKVSLAAGYATLALGPVGAANAGNYSVVITSAYGSATSAVVTLTVQSPPVITTQPTGQVATVGGNAGFSVSVAGDPPFNDAWYLGGTNLVQSGPGGTLTLTNVAAANAGNYTVVVTNNSGSVTSRVAALTLAVPPAVMVQPVSQTNLVGTTVGFNVALDGVGAGPFTWQWQCNGTNLPNGLITTVAGNGTAGFAGDGGAATSASLDNPAAVACDTVGNLYIADYVNNRIRKVAPNGIITTVAGGGGSGLGDGAVATKATLFGPSGVALDAAGNLYIADLENSRIRRVATNGIISTVAGNGVNTFAGDGGPAVKASLYFPAGVALDAMGNLYVADQDNGRIRRVAANGSITTVAGNGVKTYAGDGGAATLAGLFYPAGVTLDPAGNLYVADRGNNRIRRVDTNDAITTVAGKSAANFTGDGGAATNASLDYPLGTALDAYGNLFIADGENNRIRQVAPNGIITTLAGNGAAVYVGDGGPATNASLSNPVGVALDVSGNLYVADKGNECIRKVWLYAGQPALTLGPLNLANAGNYSVVITSSYGSVTSQVATLTLPYPPAISAQPVSQVAALGASPGFSVTVAGSGPFGFGWYFNGTNLLSSGTNNTLTLAGVTTNNAGPYTVVITNSFGSVTSQVAVLTLALPPTVALQPTSQAIPAGGTVSFSVTAGGSSAGPFTCQWQFNGANLPNGIITTVAGNGVDTYAGDGGAAANASLFYPSGVAFDAAGNLYIADSWNNRIRRMGVNGVITTVAGPGPGSAFAGDGGAAINASLAHPSGVACDAAGNLYIADYVNNRIRKVAPNGIITTVAGGGGSGLGDGAVATNATLFGPSGVALDAHGNLYLADNGNNRIRRMATNGIITTVAGNGTGTYAGDGGPATNASLYNPKGVALDAVGNLYIADYRNDRIRMVTTNGIITTVAGQSGSGYSGDGGPATTATLFLPSGVALDAFGNLYIADQNNNRIRQVAANGIITTVAGNGVGTYAGDGSAATNASLSNPVGVALDVSGNLYVADYFNDRVRKMWLFASYPTLNLGPVTSANAGNYSLVITSSYGSVTSAVATLTVLYPPAITTQPTGRFAVVGSNPAFSVAVTGTPPFNYSWYFNGTNLLESGTNNTLALSNVTTNNAGIYTVVITNNYGGVTSQGAALTVGFPPSVTVQPTAQTNLAGTTVNFGVTAGGGGPFTYEWQFNGASLPNNLITTVAGGGPSNSGGDSGPATNASLYYPSGVAFDAYGNLYVADTDHSRIRMVDGNGIIHTVAGKYGSGYSGDGGPATNASLNYPLARSDSVYNTVWRGDLYDLSNCKPNHPVWCEHGLHDAKALPVWIFSAQKHCCFRSRILPTRKWRH